jgi:hypothetical protein
MKNPAQEIVEIAPADKVSIVEAAQILGVAPQTLSRILANQDFLPEVPRPPIRRIDRLTRCLHRVDIERAARLGFADAVAGAQEAANQRTADACRARVAKLVQTLARKRAAREACHA